MKGKNYLEDSTKEENSTQNEFADDIVFARFINYMQIALFHKKLDYNKHQDFLRRQEEKLNYKEWSVLSNEDNMNHSFFTLNYDYDYLWFR